MTLLQGLYGSMVAADSCYRVGIPLQLFDSSIHEGVYLLPKYWLYQKCGLNGMSAPLAKVRSKRHVEAFYERDSSQIF